MDPSLVLLLGPPPRLSSVVEMEWKVREGEKRDGERVRVGYADTGVHCHDDSSSSADGGASVDALALDQLAHTLAGGRDPRDSKSCRLTGRAFARTCSAAQRSPSPAHLPDPGHARPLGLRGARRRLTHRCTQARRIQGGRCRGED